MKLIITLFLCMAFLGATAQDKFAPGFYVTEAGDTIHGLIRYRNKYGDGFSFRQELKSMSQKFSPSETRAFGFDHGLIYESIPVSIRKRPAVPGFVNVLIRGEIDLYLHQRNFIIGSAEKGRFKLIKGKSSNAAVRLRNQQANTGAFNVLFQDCPRVKEMAETVSVQDTRLREITRSYHECRNVAYEEFFAPRNKLFKQFGFFVGETISSLSFDSPYLFPSTSYLSNADFGTSSDLTFGVVALIGSRNPSGVAAFEGGLAYSKGSFNGTFVYTNEVAGFDIRQSSVTTLDYSRISLSGGLRLTARATRLHPYASFGVAAQRFLSVKSHVSQTTEINSSVDVEDFELNTNENALAFWCTAGLKMNVAGKRSLFLDVNYEYTLIADRGTIATLAPRIGFLF